MEQGLNRFGPVRFRKNNFWLVFVWGDEILIFLRLTEMPLKSYSSGCCVVKKLMPSAIFSLAPLLPKSIKPVTLLFFFFFFTKIPSQTPRLTCPCSESPDSVRFRLRSPSPGRHEHFSNLDGFHPVWKWAGPSSLI